MFTELFVSLHLKQLLFLNILTMRKLEKWMLAAIVITTTKVVAPEDASGPFGTASFHENDYPLYYFNIKANAATRVAAYLSK